MTPLETPKLLSERLREATDAVKNAKESVSQGPIEQLSALLTEVKNSVQSSSAEARESLSTQISTASAVLEKFGEKNTYAQEAKRVIADIGTNLQSLRESIGATGEKTWIDSAADMFETTEGYFGTAWAATGGALLAKMGLGAPATAKSSVNIPAAYMKQFGVSMLGFVPFVSSLPFVSELQESVKETFAHIKATREVERLVKVVNAKREKEKQPLLYTDLGNMEAFAVHIPKERRGNITEIAKAIIAKEETDTLTWENLGENISVIPAQPDAPKLGVEKKEGSESETALPSTPLAIADLEAGVEFGEFGTVRVVKSPATISLNKKVWRMKGKAWTKESFATFEIKKADWNGSALTVDVVGSVLGFSGQGQGNVPSGAIRSFLSHLKYNTDPYPLLNSDGRPSNVELILS
ncbi:MAG: hypothetical protein O3A80_03205 [bacterium]|nr:hypothetical protein [bacterium]